MRTRDFSKAPALARAEAIVVALFVTVGTGSRPDARGSAGFVWQRRLRQGGLRGVIAFFETADAARGFAASVSGAAGVSFTRVFSAEPDGYSNGVWRAEDNTMRHIERFTPLTAEVERGAEPPAVADERAHAPTRNSRGAASASAASKPPKPPKQTIAHLADATAMFVGATRYRGPQSWLILSKTWYPMVAKMQRMSGFRWFGVYYAWPFTLGTLAFFATRDDLLAFARMPEHRELMQWITRGTRNGTGGYIRLQIAEPGVAGGAREADSADAVAASDPADAANSANSSRPAQDAP